MKEKKNLVWTEEKVNLLIDLLDQRLTYNEISKRMGLTSSSIVNYMFKHNLKNRYNPYSTKVNWSSDMINDLKHLMEVDEYSYTQISEMLSKKYSKDIPIRSIKTAAYSNGFKYKWVDPIFKWSDELDTQLINYMDQGLSYVNIAKKMNKTMHTIRDRCFYLGINRPLSYKKFTKEEEISIATLFHLGARTPDIIRKYNGEISEMRIRFFAKKHNLPRLSPQQQAELGYRWGEYLGIKKEDLVNLIEEGNSIEKLAEIYNTEIHKINWFLKQFDIKVSLVKYKSKKEYILERVLGRKPTLEEIESSLDKNYADIIGKDLLIDKLQKNNLCIDRVAIYFDVDASVIFGAIAKFNINLDDLEVKVDQDNFLSGFRSYGEYCTACALIMLSLNYNKEYIIKVPLHIRQSGMAKIDFYLSYNGKVFWIEYNGEQHYHKFAGGTKFSESFEDRVKRDLYVKKRAKDEGITFIEIPYTYYSTKKIQDLLQRVIINGEDINNIIDYTPFYKEIEELGIGIEDNESESD